VKEQKVLDLSADPTSMQSKDPGSFELNATLKGTTSFDEIIGAVQATLDEAARGQLATEKIEAARDHLLNATILRMQTPAQVATMLALATGAVGDVHAFEHFMAALAAVKPEDVARVAKLLSPARRDVVTLTGGGVAAPAQSPTKSPPGAADKKAPAAKGGTK
jgi:predicted Zn-dependent peptidase